jgi:hypothetical protein
LDEWLGNIHDDRPRSASKGANGHAFAWEKCCSSFWILDWILQRPSPTVVRALASADMLAARPLFGSSHAVVPEPYRPAPRKSTAVTTKLNIPARPFMKATAGPATMSRLMVPKLRRNSPPNFSKADAFLLTCSVALGESRSHLVSLPHSQPETHPGTVRRRQAGRRQLGNGEHTM